MRHLSQQKRSMKSHLLAQRSESERVNSLFPQRMALLRPFSSSVPSSFPPSFLIDNTHEGMGKK